MIIYVLSLCVLLIYLYTVKLSLFMISIKDYFELSPFKVIGKITALGSQSQNTNTCFLHGRKFSLQRGKPCVPKMRPSLVSFNEIPESADREWKDLEDAGSMKLNKEVRVGIIVLFHYRISLIVFLNSKGFKGLISKENNLPPVLESSREDLNAELLHRRTLLIYFLAFFM